MKLKRYVKIEEPIDYETLQTAFQAAGWKWTTKTSVHLLREDFPDFPSAERIRRTVADLAAHNSDVASGGLRVANGVVFLAPKLAEKYLPPALTVEREEDL